MVEILAMADVREIMDICEVEPLVRFQDTAEDGVVGERGVLSKGERESGRHGNKERGA